MEKGDVEVYLSDLFHDVGKFGGFASGEGVYLQINGYVAHIVVKSVEPD